MVWETAENIRVPLHDWDLSLSFDLDNYGGSNIYCPYWLFSTDVFGDHQGGTFGRAIPLGELLSARTIERVPPKFCAAFLRNPEPRRLRALNALRRHGQVDVYGRHTGKYIHSKSHLSGQYKFILAFENTLYPGYITEKLIESWAMEAIPLWSGPRLGSELFNHNAFLNLEPHHTIEEFCGKVGALAQDWEWWMKAAATPLLRREPEVNQIRAAVSRVLSRAVAASPQR